MANPQNLKPITTKKLARERGSKGGSARTLAQKLRARKYCDSKCPLWQTCWARPTAENIFTKNAREWERNKRIAKGTNTKFTVKKPRKICYLKKAPNDMIRTTLSFIEDGESAFDKLLTKLTLTMSDIIKFDDLREISILSKEARENKKAIYGDRRRIDANVESGQLDAERIRKIFEESKESETE